MLRFLIPAILLSLITCQLLVAQPEIGFYAGLKNGKFNGDAPRKGIYRPRLGYDFGTHLEFDISDAVKLSFQPGIGFGGSVIAFEDTVAGRYKDSLDVRITNLLLPLYAKVASSNEKLYFLGGLKTGININTTGDDSMEEFDLKKEFKAYNLSALFGLGILFPFESSLLYIEFRYSQGLLNITNAPDDELARVPRVKTSSFNLIFGWKLPLIKKKQMK